jgi:hypothetical protein
MPRRHTPSPRHPQRFAHAVRLKSAECKSRLNRAGSKIQVMFWNFDARQNIARKADYQSK